MSGHISCTSRVIVHACGRRGMNRGRGDVGGDELGLGAADEREKAAERRNDARTATSVLARALKEK